MAIIRLTKLILNANGRPAYRGRKRQFESIDKEIPEGELVLISQKGRKTRMQEKQPDETPTPNLIGVSVGVETEQQGYRLVLENPHYYLLGQLEIDGRSFPGINSSSDNKLDSRHIDEIIVGKEAILERILKDYSLRLHAEWIKKMEKPYEFPEMGSVKYFKIPKDEASKVL